MRRARSWSDGLTEHCRRSPGAASRGRWCTGGGGPGWCRPAGGGAGRRSAPGGRSGSATTPTSAGRARLEPNGTALVSKGNAARHPLGRAAERPLMGVWVPQQRQNESMEGGVFIPPLGGESSSERETYLRPRAARCGCRGRRRRPSGCRTSAAGRARSWST